MDKLGFKYSTRKKTYYIDGHERPDNVAYRKEYIKRYLSYKRRCFRWIQLSEKEVEELEKEDELFTRDDGFKYKKNDLTYFEFHVDDHSTFQSKCNHLLFGGHLSVRKKQGEKTIIMIGQDEAIFKQFLISAKQWNLPDGTCAPNPKDEGQGVMLSIFVSQDFGYGLTSAQKILQRSMNIEEEKTI